LKEVLHAARTVPEKEISKNDYGFMTTLRTSFIILIQ